MKRDLTLWVVGVLAAIIVSMSAYLFKQLANDVKQLHSTVLSLDDTLNETNLLLRANGIGWPEPVRRDDE